MDVGRYFTAGVNYDSTLFWVTGGYDGGQKSSITELIDVKINRARTFVELPVARELHNLIKINDTLLHDRRYTKFEPSLDLYKGKPELDLFA